MLDSRAVRVLGLVAAVMLAGPWMSEGQVQHDTETSPACVEPRPADENLVRRAADWMFPSRTIEVPPFNVATQDTPRRRPARATQSGTPLSLTPISRSVSRTRSAEFSIAATMTMIVNLRVDYPVDGATRGCDLSVQGPFAVRADVMVDRSQADEDRVQPLTVTQVNDGGLQLQGCRELADLPRVTQEVKDHIVALALAGVFTPACRPCDQLAFQACTTP